jgi:hypothetical protein
MSRRRPGRAMSSLIQDWRELRRTWKQFAAALLSISADDLNRRSVWRETHDKSGDVSQLDWLWREYVLADPAMLTQDARELADQLRQKVRELAGAGKLEERIGELEEAIRKAIENLKDHDDEPVYGPYSLADTRCVVPDGKVCEVIDELQAILDKGEEG